MSAVSLIAFRRSTSQSMIVSSASPVVNRRSARSRRSSKARRLARPVSASSYARRETCETSRCVRRRPRSAPRSPPGSERRRREDRVAGGGGGPDTAPSAALHLDRDAHVRGLLELPEGARSCSGRRRGRRRRRSRGAPVSAIAQNQGVGRDLVDLVGGELPLAGPEVADADQHPVSATLVLEPADRERSGADGGPRLGRDHLEDLVEIHHRGGRGDNPQQGFPLLGSEGRGAHPPPIGITIPES